EFFHRAEEELADCSLGPVHVAGDFRERLAVQVPQFHGLALVFGQLGEGVGQLVQLLLPQDLLAGRWAFARQPALQKGRRFLHSPLQERSRLTLRASVAYLRMASARVLARIVRSHAAVWASLRQKTWQVANLPTIPKAGTGYNHGRRQLVRL